MPRTGTPPVDAYAVLGVPATASQASLKEAHRRLAWIHHPDRVPLEEREAATRRIQEINVAYGLVRTPAARARYDALRRQGLGALRRDGRAGLAPELRYDWDELMVAAGRWAGRWWARNEGPLRRASVRAAKRARRAGVRVATTVTTIAYVWLGLVFTLAAQQLAGSGNVLPPLVGAAGGAIAGTIQGRDRLRALDGHPPMRFPWLPVALWLGLLAVVVAIVYV